MSTNTGYEINERDIDGMVRFLKTTDPEHATPEMAIALLEHFQAKFHMLGHTDPDKLYKMLINLNKESEEYKKLLKKLERQNI
ncbi:MAG TPA: hypothetical protein VLF89_07165 [Candidatus Saccharimonadales bacterium]|nr:hypothetical protein [Candidatus Saccharimonadales bacterium]